MRTTVIDECPTSEGRDKEVGPERTRVTTTRMFWTGDQTGSLGRLSWTDLVVVGESGRWMRRGHKGLSPASCRSIGRGCAIFRLQTEPQVGREGGV